MAIADVLANTTITGYTPAVTTQIENIIKDVYANSAKGQAMLDQVTAADPMEIKFVAGQARAFRGTGNVEIDPAAVTDLAFWDKNGTGVAVTLENVLIHEMVHALENIGDTPRGTSSTADAKGPTLVFEEAINDQLGSPNRLSYEGVDSDTALSPGTNYTGGTAIDIALASIGSRDTSGGGSQNTKDLLWGVDGASGNPGNRDNLNSGGGNDFLYGNAGGDILTGGGGNDFINGGSSTDKAIFTGKCDDYTITANAGNGTITITDDRAGSPDGTDTLVNVETAVFSDGEMDLTTGQFTCPGQNLVMIIDTSGSMSDDIEAVKNSARQIIDALFGTTADPVASELAIITYTSSPNTVLSFTKDASIADRKAAALAAINTLGATSGSTENLNTALLHAIDGNAGVWNAGNKSNKIVVFTDEDSDDPGKRAEVIAKATAANIALPPLPPGEAPEGNQANGSGFFDITAGTFTDPTQAVPVQVLPVLIGNSGSATTDITALANDTNGQVFNAADATQVVPALLNAINSQIGGAAGELLEGDAADNPISGLGGDDSLFGFGGDDSLDGGTGNDDLNGGTGNDELLGGDGDDNIVDPLGNTNADGGAGNDQIAVFNGLNSLAGGDGADGIGGGMQDDAISGGAGNDLLVGDLYAGILQGSDRIDGGDGNDKLMGRGGADTFVFGVNGGTDTIAEFDVAGATRDAAGEFVVSELGGDFQDGIDHIELNGFATVDATNIGTFLTGNPDGSTTFSAEGTTIQFVGVEVGDLTADDFVFV